MERVIIMGAAGRDFHNFNVYFRDNPAYEVVAFTAAQIPGIESRIYPPSLTGTAYPDGIPILAETDLPELIKQYDVDQVIFAYSDVSYAYVMHTASLVLAKGADFRLMGPGSTMLKSRRPVVAVTAVRTGSGKSQTARYVGRLLHEAGQNVVIVRHPMPYGSLETPPVQRYAHYEDLDRYNCTIEEREEFEPYLDNGMVVYAGIDYEQILHQAEAEADVIVWDGGNNDFPFYYSDLHIVVLDPHRAGAESSYHPGETNLRMADVTVINKVDTADSAKVASVQAAVNAINPQAAVILANSPLTVEGGELIRGKKVLVIEDGPTLTHGDMAYGAGVIAAQRMGAAELIDPRPYAVGSIAETLREWNVGRLLPAMGYSPLQISELQQTINNSPAELVVIGTPIDLRRFMNISKPAVRVRYELEEINPQLNEWLKKVLHL